MLLSSLQCFISCIFVTIIHATAHQALLTGYFCSSHGLDAKAFHFHPYFVDLFNARVNKHFLSFFSLTVTIWCIFVSLPCCDLDALMWYGFQDTSRCNFEIGLGILPLWSGILSGRDFSPCFFLHHCSQMCHASFPGVFVPTAQTFASSAINTLGYSLHTTGYWAHSLQVSV